MLAVELANVSRKQSFQGETIQGDSASEVLFKDTRGMMLSSGTRNQGQGRSGGEKGDFQTI